MAINNQLSLSCRRSNELQKGGDCRVYTIKSNRQVDAQREAVYRDPHRTVNLDVYREIGRQVYQVDQDSTEAAYREHAPMKPTGWSPKQTLIDDYRVKHHLEVNATYR
jgi:hypothetical protein